MLDASVENPARKPVSWLGWLIVVMMVPLLVLLLTPIDFGMSRTMAQARNTAARESASQIVTAIKAYKSDYGRLPGSRENGHYEDMAGNAEIFSVLRAMNTEQNPRQISYFEARNVKSSRLIDGFDPRTGVLYDPFGQPYRIRVIPRLAMHTESPYADVPASRSEVIVWSIGPDGKQGNPNDPRKFAGSDDIYQGLP